MFKKTRFLNTVQDEKTHVHVIRRLHLLTDRGLMNGPDTHGLTGISSAPDRKDTTKGTAVKDTIPIGHECTAWEWRFMQGGIHVRVCS